jgi:hypothetical protein
MAEGNCNGSLGLERAKVSSIESFVPRERAALALHSTVHGKEDEEQFPANDSKSKRKYGNCSLVIDSAEGTPMC